MQSKHLASFQKERRIKNKNTNEKINCSTFKQWRSDSDYTYILQTHEHEHTHAHKAPISISSYTYMLNVQSILSNLTNLYSIVSHLHANTCSNRTLSILEGEAKR